MALLSGEYMSDDNTGPVPPPFDIADQRTAAALRIHALADLLAAGALEGIWLIAIEKGKIADITSEGLIEGQHDAFSQRLRNDADDILEACESPVEDWGELQAAPDDAQDLYDCAGRLSFSTALAAAKDDRYIRRIGWNGAGLSVRMHIPSSREPVSIPYLVIVNPMTHPTAPGLCAPWVPSQTDMMADDWMIVGPLAE